jgi:hypothetical protein
MSTEIAINIQDVSGQSIKSYPITYQSFVVYDLTTRYFFSDAYHIGVIAPDVDQTKIHFTSGFHGATISDEAEFINHFQTEIEVPIKSKSIHPSLEPIVAFINTMGIQGQAEGSNPTEETHKISGTVTDDSKVIILDAVTSELIKAENVSSGRYTVTVPNQTVDILAKNLDTGEPKAYTGVVPVHNN